MAKRKLVNVTFGKDEFFKPFSVNGYRFYSKHSRSNNSAEGRTVRISIKAVQDERRHKQNAYVEFQGRQQESILFRGGYEGPRPPGRRRKFLEDILVVGSILTGKNWLLYSMRNRHQYPVISSIHLEGISENSESAETNLNQAISKIDDSRWQIKYEDGFHLIMLLNHSNIINAESRFLSNVVIWEWLYPHLKSSNQATIHDESKNLLEIFNFVLRHFWPNQLNNNIFQDDHAQGKLKNIFHVLRNQLAHSGKLPINRPSAENWMKDLQWDYDPGRKGIKDYLKFFDRLTQIVVLKTLGIDGENSLIKWNFPEQLSSFLNTGKIQNAGC